jgi:hypothetical protein
VTIRVHPIPAGGGPPSGSNPTKPNEALVFPGCTIHGPKCPGTAHGTVWLSTRGVEPGPSPPFPGRTIRDSGGREGKPQVALVSRRRRRSLQPLLPVFLLHRRPERGFTERIASVFISSPGFALSGGDCPSLPEICSAADPRLLRRELRLAGPSPTLLSSYLIGMVFLRFTQIWSTREQR